MSLFNPIQPTSGDSETILWKKILQLLQAQSASPLAHNNPNIEDSLRMTLVKILRALLGI